MSNLKDEKMQILKMVEEGKISSEEAINLIETLENTEEEKAPLVGDNKAKWIKIKVFESEDNNKVDVKIPVSLVNIGLKIANKVSPDFKSTGIDGKDLEEIFEEIKNGASGKLVDVESDNGDRVEIIVE